MSSIPMPPLAASSFLRGLFAGFAWSYDEPLTPSEAQPTTPPAFCLADFDMNTLTGFLPDQPPLVRLPPEFDLWESALDVACSDVSLGDDTSAEADAKRDSSHRWRERLRSAPVLSTVPLNHDIRCLRRAHHVLAFLVQFYVQSIPLESNPQPLVVPASLSVPLIAVSDVLDIAPILTFADTVLWNWALIDPRKPLSLDNMRALSLFTRGQADRGASEENFYICCASIELRGVEALNIIIDYHRAKSAESPRVIQEIARSLGRLSTVVDELTCILKSVRDTCDPHAFYFHIRPWYRGSDANGPDSRGWTLESVDPSRRLELSGPSAGQSSMMHALDVFLAVDNQLANPHLPAPAAQNARSAHNFMMRMRKYMPGKHRAFLQRLAEQPRSIRELARSTPALREPYDSVVLALKHFRDQHMRIACLYVVSMSRSVAAAAKSGSAMAMIEAEGGGGSTLRKPVRGTGGNELSVLLKASRDATKRTALDIC